MNLQHRIDLLVRLGQYILSADEEWLECKERASRENGWFIPEFIELATRNIARFYLENELLKNWVASYQIPLHQTPGTTVGIVMAGNIPWWVSMIFFAFLSAVIRPLLSHPPKTRY